MYLIFHQPLKVRIDIDSNIYFRLTAIDSVYFETLFSELSLTTSSKSLQYDDNIGTHFTVHPTIMSSPAKNNTILILSTVSSVVFAVIIIISMIILTSFCLRKKRNEGIMQILASINNCLL